MFSNQLRVMGFAFFPTCLPRPGWSLDLLTLIKRISLHHERQRSPRDLKTSEGRRRTDGPSRHQPNKSLFFFLPLARRRPAKLWAQCDAGGRLVQTGSYTLKKNLVLFFFKSGNCFHCLRCFGHCVQQKVNEPCQHLPSPPPRSKSVQLTNVAPLSLYVYLILLLFNLKKNPQRVIVNGPMDRHNATEDLFNLGCPFFFSFFLSDWSHKWE